MPSPEGEGSRQAALQTEACALGLSLKCLLEEATAHSKGLNNQEDRSGLGIHKQSLLKYLKGQKPAANRQWAKNCPKTSITASVLTLQNRLSSSISPELQTHISNNLLDLLSKCIPPSVSPSQRTVPPTQSPKPET